MANYEKQVEQEAAYPIPISLYNCYRTVRQEKRGIAIYILLIAFLMPHCPVTVVQRYRDGVCSLLFHLFFIICHPYIPLHLEEMIFYTCTLFITTLAPFVVLYCLVSSNQVLCILSKCDTFCCILCACVCWPYVLARSGELLLGFCVRASATGHSVDQ